MIRELELQRKSEHTISSYVSSVAQLAAHYNRPPEEISRDEVRDFIHFLIAKRKQATATVHTKLAGIQFYYQHVLGQPKFDLKIHRKRPGRLPEPLARSEVRKVFQGTKNPKHRAMLMTTYAAGLRVSEVMRLKVSDIHSERMMIHVRSGKGDKDRFTLLSTRLLQELRQYWLAQRPSGILFPNRDGQPMSRASLQRVFYQAKKRAGIAHGNGIHCLRHSFATHLLEAGVDLTIIARLLGHRSLSTTSRYLHVTSKHVQGICSPLDLLRMPSREDVTDEADA
jgi:site-specific recombinase XerD